MKRRILAATTVFAVGLGALTAEGVAMAGAAPPQPAKTPKSCSLLRTREVSKLVGMKMHGGKSRKIPRQPGVKSDRCDWESTKKGAGGVQGERLQLTVASFTGKDARLYFYGLRDQNAATGFPYEPVPDLGTDAYYQGSLNTVSVLTSDTRFLAVRLNRDTLDTSNVDLDPKDVAVAAATAVVPRLEKG